MYREKLKSDYIIRQVNAEQREAMSGPFLSFPKTFHSKCIVKMPYNVWNLMPPNKTDTK